MVAIITLGCAVFINIIKQAIKAHTIKGTIAIIIPFIAFIKNNVSLFTGKL